MNTKTLTITVLLAALILTPLAIAGPDGGPEGGNRGRGRGGFRGPGMGGAGSLLRGRMAEELGLTADQKEKIQAIEEANREKEQATNQAVREAMETLNTAVEDGNEAKIITAGKAVGETMTQQALQRAANLKAVKAVLTEEQIAKMKEMQAEMRERMQQRRQNRPERGQGQGQGQGQRQGRGRGPAQD